MPTELKVIMFTDQIGSTLGMKGRTTDETWQVADTLSRLTIEAARICRGVILKDTGDGNMIAFRSCTDAVRCGLLIQQHLEHHNLMAANPRLKFELHIGIDVGEAVVLANNDLRSNAANTAARVCGHGPAGLVFFTEAVANFLNPREVSFKKAGLFDLKGVGQVTLYVVEKWLEIFYGSSKQFVWRDGITDADDFFGRGKEQRTIRDYLEKSQNCQVVGPRRIGKTSLLRQIERRAREWDARAAVAFADMQDPKYWTLKDWLRHVTRQWAWEETPDSLSLFSERLEDAITGGLRPVLCLDEFEEMAKRGTEFTEDFLLAHRACGQKGLAIITASRETLDKITDPRSKSSSYFNTFPSLKLGLFTEPEAQDFVNAWRVGHAPFTDEEKRGILAFARRHPLALQIACYHVLEARETGYTPATALDEAREQARLMLREGW